MDSFAQNALRPMYLRKETYKKIFKPDSGALLFVVVFDVNPTEWQNCLDYVREKFLVAYSENGTQKTSPNVESIFEVKSRASITLEILLEGFTLNFHFQRPDCIEMNVLPEEVNSVDKADAVIELMKGIADRLGKPVFLVPEYGSATDDQLREKAMCVAEPNLSVRSRFE